MCQNFEGCCHVVVGHYDDSVGILLPSMASLSVWWVWFLPPPRRATFEIGEAPRLVQDALDDHPPADAAALMDPPDVAVPALLLEGQ